MDPLKGKTSGMQRPGSVSTKLQRIATLAREQRGLTFTSLHHHIDGPFLMEAVRRTRKSGAAGVDGRSGADFLEDLDGNVAGLLDKFKSGRYRAPPVRRVHIPKGGGKTRPLGIPTFEDKVLQTAVAMLLNAIYEQDFLDCSYGFRPGRSAHDALRRLWGGLMKMRGGWVLELDIKSFFDTLDHGQPRSFLDKRVRDGVVRRTIDKWLKAGVLENGRVRRLQGGPPQGGVISPLLANVYLHEVLDLWFEHVVRPRLRGHAFAVRYADDATLVFEYESDARRVLEVLPKRFGKHGLTLHPEKTRLIDFRRPRHQPEKYNDVRRPSRSFDLLGYTVHWGRSRKGNWVVKWSTSSKSFRRSLKAIADWCRRFRHRYVRCQWEQLRSKLRGHYHYFGLPFNYAALSRFRHRVERVWHKWLGRRSQRRMNWARFGVILRRFPLPRPRLLRIMLAKP